jgi:hypothetical protein
MGFKETPEFVLGLGFSGAHIFQTDLNNFFI